MIWHLDTLDRFARIYAHSTSNFWNHLGPKSITNLFSRFVYHTEEKAMESDGKNDIFKKSRGRMLYAFSNFYKEKKYQ